MLKYLVTLIQSLLSGKMELGESVSCRDTWLQNHHQQGRGWSASVSKVLTEPRKLNSQGHGSELSPPSYRHSPSWIFSSNDQNQALYCFSYYRLGFLLFVPLPHIHTFIWQRKKKLLKMLAKDQRDVSREGRKKNIKKGEKSFWSSQIWSVANVNLNS